MTDLSKLTAEELKAELEKREAEAIAKRERERKAYEALRENTCVTLCKEAAEIQARLSTFKKKAFENMAAVYKLLQEYSDSKRERKGNFKIEKGNFKIVYSKQGKGTFDERAEQAEQHIYDFVTSHFSGDKDTQDFILSLLERKKGELDINLVQRLYQMEDRYNDENWRKGIALLKESYSFTHSKDYINFYIRNDKGVWENVSLQFSSI